MVAACGLFSGCGQWGLLFIIVQGILIAVASLVTEHGPKVYGLQQLWPTGLAASHPVESRPRIKPMSSALAGGFLTTGPPAKSLGIFLIS